MSSQKQAGNNESIIKEGKIISGKSNSNGGNSNNNVDENEVNINIMIENNNNVELSQSNQQNNIDEIGKDDTQQQRNEKIGNISLDDLKSKNSTIVQEDVNYKFINANVIKIKMGTLKDFPQDGVNYSCDYQDNMKILNSKVGKTGRKKLFLDNDRKIFRDDKQYSKFSVTSEKRNQSLSNFFFNFSDYIKERYLKLSSHTNSKTKAHINRLNETIIVENEKVVIRKGNSSNRNFHKAIDQNVERSAIRAYASFLLLAFGVEKVDISFFLFYPFHLFYYSLYHDNLEISYST